MCNVLDRVGSGNPREAGDRRMLKITWTAVIETAERLASEVGFDYRYTSQNGECGPNMACRNWHNNKDGSKTPGCIVGTILYRLGVSLEEMFQSMSSPRLLDSLVLGDVIEAPSEEVRKFFEYAQCAQDSGATWWSAVRVARRAAEEICS
jgi:hypothetical protein